MNDLDRSLMLALNFDGGTFWDAVMRFASGIPNWIPLYVIVLFIIYCKGGWKYMLFLLITVGLGVGICDQICNFFKANVEYPRPVQVEGLVDQLHVLFDRFSRTRGTVSGHASTSFCVFLLTALAMRKGWFTAIMLLYTLLTSYSRIYISAHFPFQILFGWMLGTLVALLLWWCFSKLNRRFAWEKTPAWVTRTFCKKHASAGC